MTALITLPHSCMCVNKGGMSQSGICFPRPCRKWDHLETRMYSDGGVYFVIYKNLGGARYNVWLGRISPNVKIEDIFLQQVGNNLSQDQEKWWHIYKCEEQLKACVVYVSGGSYNCFSEERPYYAFSNLCDEDKAEITTYQLQEDRPRRLWCRKIQTGPDFRITASPKYVAALTHNGIVIIRMSDGERLKTVSLPKSRRSYSWLSSSVIISPKYLLVRRILQRHAEREGALLGLDLDSFKLERLDIGTKFGADEDISLHLFNGGKLAAIEVVTGITSNLSISILDLSTSDLKQAFNERRVMYQSTNGNSAKMRDFQEVRKGVCAFQTGSCRNGYHGQLQLVSWESVNLPRALEEFVNSNMPNTSDE